MEERMAREARAGVRMLSHWLLEPRGAVGWLSMAVSWHGLILAPHTITNMRLLRLHTPTTICVLQSVSHYHSLLLRLQTTHISLSVPPPSGPLNNPFIVIHFKSNSELFHDFVNAKTKYFIWKILRNSYSADLKRCWLQVCVTAKDEPWWAMMIVAQQGRNLIVQRQVLILPVTSN